MALSGLRHRAAEFGQQAIFLQKDTYREALEQVNGRLIVGGPMTWAHRVVDELGVLDSRPRCTRFAPLSDR